MTAPDVALPEWVEWPDLAEESGAAWTAREAWVARWAAEPEPEPLEPDDEDVPVSFADRRPRPGLLLGLAGSDPGAAVGETAEAAMSAGFALENHVAWLKLRWLREACRSRAGTTVRVEDDPWAGQVAAAALGWSMTMAVARLELADGVSERLPAVGEAMRTGVLQETKASLFVTVLRELDTDQARTVVDRVLPRAPGTPHQKLRAMIENAAAEIDPAWDAARRAAATARARVLTRIGPSGAAELCGLDLPWEAAKESYDHLVAIADAVLAALRARGEDHPLGKIQAHVFLRLLAPDPPIGDDPEIVAWLVDELTGTPPADGPDPDDLDGPDGPDDPGPDGPGPDAPDDLGPGAPDDLGPDDHGPNDSGPNDSGPNDSDDVGPDPDDGPGPDGADPADRMPPNADPDRDTDTDTGPPGPAEPDPSAAPEPENSADAAGLAGSVAAGAGRRLAYRRRLAVRMSLTTLLGLTRRPGEMPGWGTVAAGTATRLAWERRAATWRVLVHGVLGTLEHVLVVRPPGGHPPGRETDPHRRQSVELIVHADELAGVDPAQTLVPEFAAAVQAALGAANARPADEHPAHTLADAGRRLPGAGLDAWVRARDRTCRFPGCSRPALDTDLDHTIAVEHDGLTVARNLGALCRTHHRMKHDPRSGWTLTQPVPGTFVWVGPNGVRHRVDAEPLLAPLSPRPPADGSGFSVPTGSLAGPFAPRPWAPRRNRWGFVTDAARATAETIAVRYRRDRGQPGQPLDDGEPPF